MNCQRGSDRSTKVLEYAARCSSKESGPGSVVRPDDIAEPRGLDEVSQLEVESQPLDDAGGIKGEVLDRPAAALQRPQRALERGPLPLPGAIVHQGVVHVVADGA